MYGDEFAKPGRREIHPRSRFSEVPFFVGPRLVGVLEAFVLAVSSKEVQNCIFEIQEDLQFIDELLKSVKNEEIQCFMFNSFTIGVVVHLILPTFRADVLIKNGRKFGINSVLFLIDLVLREIKNESMNLTFALDGGVSSGVTPSCFT